MRDVIKIILAFVFLGIVTTHWAKNNLKRGQEPSQRVIDMTTPVKIPTPDFSDTKKETKKREGRKTAVDSSNVRVPGLLRPPSEPLEKEPEPQ